MSSNKITLSELKEKLTAYGLPTSTPDLVGEPRYQELLSRLQNHEKDKNIASSSNKTKDDANNSSSSSSANDTLEPPNAVTASLQSLSINDIKAKLALYGEVSL